MKPVTPAEQSNSSKNIAEAEADLSKVCVKFAIKGGAFMSIIFYSLQKEITDAVPTAATNGKKIMVNPDFWMGLSEKEKLFLLAHEVMHIAMMHLTRRGSRDPKLWNSAADYAINAILVHEFKDAEYIPGGLYDEDFYNMSTEKIYEILQNDPDQHESTLGADIIEGEIKDFEVQHVIAQAAQMAELSSSGIGTESDVMKQLILQIRSPKVNWRDVLYDFVSKRCKDAYSFTRRNRRYNDVYLPSMYSLGTGAIGVYIDVSGSVEDETIGKFLSAIQCIQTDCNPENVDIMSFNTEIQEVFSYPRGELIPNGLHLDIHGGTRINCVYEDFMHKNYECIVVFTDGCFHPPVYKTPDNILWIIYDDELHEFSSRCPGGSVIYVD